MLDLIMIVYVIIMADIELAYLLLQADKLVKQDKLKNSKTFEDTTKKIRKSGIFWVRGFIR